MKGTSSKSKGTPKESPSKVKDELEKENLRETPKDKTRDNNREEKKDRDKSKLNITNMSRGRDREIRGGGESDGNDSYWRKSNMNVSHVS